MKIKLHYLKWCSPPRTIDFLPTFPVPNMGNLFHVIDQQNLRSAKVMYAITIVLSCLSGLLEGKILLLKTLPTKNQSANK